MTEQEEIKFLKDKLERIENITHTGLGGHDKKVYKYALETILRVIAGQKPMSHIKNRFKFRAWDEDKNRLVYDFETVPYFESRVITKYNEPDCMQYTCIDDDDGVEIYEGDFVIDGAEDNLTAGLVVWDKGNFRIELIGIRGNKRTKDTKDIGRSFGTYYLNSRKGYGLKVVGNRYTTPNIIKELGEKWIQENGKED